MENAGNHATAIKASIAGAFAFLTALWGWLGWMIVGWVVLMGIDWLSGSAVGTKNQEWSSARAREGIWHKGGMILIVLCAGGADLLLGAVVNHIPGIVLPFEYTVAICPLVLAWYIVTELGSIVENAVALGAPCPEFLKKALKVMDATIIKAGDAAVGGTDDE